MNQPQFPTPATRYVSRRASNSVDWYVRDSVRAKLRLMVKTILKKWKYPPDGQDKATETVLEQAEALSQAWATV